MTEPLRDLDPAPPESLDEDARSLRLLVVVDEAEAGQAVRAALAEDPGAVDAEWVHDLDQGLARLRRRPYDVVILDMPLVGNRSLALFDEPALHDGDTWLVVIEEPSTTVFYPRRLLSRFAHETLRRDERLADTLGPLLRLARRSVGLRARASRYQSLFRHSTDGILIFDASGVVLDANPRAFELLDYRPGELLGLRMEALYPQSEHDRVQEALFALGAEGASHLEVSVRRRDGTTFPVELTASAFHGGGEELVQVVLRDLTSSRALEQRLREALSRLGVEVATLGVTHGDPAPSGSIREVLAPAPTHLGRDRG